MIEVIKSGNTKFTTICLNCGCEFSYELVDIMGGHVYCPCCGQIVIHPSQNLSDPWKALYNAQHDATISTADRPYKGSVTTCSSN